MRLVETSDNTGLRFNILADDGKLLREIAITCCTVDVDGQTVRIVYSSALEPVDYMCRFLLDKYAEAPLSTASQALSALKILAAFEEATGVPFESFDDSDTEAFLLFLRGACRRSYLLSYELTTARSENTISSYLKVYRNLARYLNLGCSPFLARIKMSDGSSRYAIAPSDPEPFETPPFITVEEFLRIEEVIKRSYGLVELCMVRLMFEHGLRVGEALGICTQDCEAAKDRNGVMRYRVYLRNRAGDGRDRRAKNLMDAKRDSDYRKPGYNKRKVGYHSVKISESLYFDLLQYMEESHGLASGAFAARREATAAADSVTGQEGNRYLFLNSLGRPLRGETWNRRLRKIFTEAGIPIDKKVKSSGLNHRFRHGYAMVLKHTLKLDDFKVMELLRHGSITSQAAYDNPTPEQIGEMQDEVIERWAREVLPCA